MGTEEEGTVVEAKALVFVPFSMLVRGRGDGFVGGFRLRSSFLFGNGGGVAATGGWDGGIGGNLLGS